MEEPGIVPFSHFSFLDSLYDGKTHLLSASTASLKLVEACNTIIDSLIQNPRTAFDRYEPAEHFEFVSKAKRLILKDDSVRSYITQLLEELGLHPETVKAEGPRLRVVYPGQHEYAPAINAYTAHRDCWYSNSQSQINFWIPLHDVKPEETFSIFPSFFKTAVPNTSRGFNFDDFNSRGGFSCPQQTKFENSFPCPTHLRAEEVSERFCPAGEKGFILLFSGSHLHQTNSLQQDVLTEARLSIDFRVVPMNQHTAGIGAPNVDNESQGDATSTYNYFA